MPSGKSVLLIDDCQNHAFFIERAFGKIFPGTVIHHLTDGERAVDHLDHCGQGRPMPDIVLLDRQMPGGMDGFETLAKLRARPHLADLAVLIVTGSDDPAQIERARIVGADGYAIKPTEQHGYGEFARQIHDWSPVRSWRTKEIVRVSCGPEVVPVRTVDSAAANVSHEHAGSYPGGHLDYAAKIAQLPLSLVLDLHVKDHGVWDKRRVFARVLFSLGWTKPEIRLFLKASVRWLEDEEGKPLPLSCGLRALALA